MTMASYRGVSAKAGTPASGGGGGGTLDGCSLKAFGMTSIPGDGNYYRLGLDSTNWDPHGFLSSGGGGQALVPFGLDGWYQISVSVQGTYYVNVPFAIAVYAASGLVIEAFAPQPPGGVLSATAYAMSAVVPLTAGQTVYVMAQQSTGSPSGIKIRALNLLKVA
jgi:hypothetical protein